MCSTSMDTEVQLYYATLYKGLKHLLIFISTGAWNQSPADTQEQLYKTFGLSRLTIYGLEVTKQRTEDPTVNVVCDFFV